MQPSTATNLWFYPCYRRSPFFAATRKTFRRLSSAISDIGYSATNSGIGSNSPFCSISRTRASWAAMSALISAIMA